MRVGYFGDGRWAQEALDRILADDELSVAFVVPRFHQPDPELRERAERHGIDFLPRIDVNAPESLELFRSFGPDVLVSMSFNQIFKNDILRLCSHGAVNCHAGKLPFYRGRNVLNWALINDEAEFGVTVHHMDEGIDTGDIILQRTSPITDADTYATLLDRAVGLCAVTLHEALRQLARGHAERLDQTTIHPVGFYTGRRVEGDEWVDWNWPSRRIFNFVRAITLPGPCARTTHENVELLIVHAELIPDAPTYIGTPGEVVGRDGPAVYVKTGDSTVALTDVRSEVDVRLCIGQRLRSGREELLADLPNRVAGPEVR